MQPCNILQLTFIPVDNDGGSVGEFKRSASARLHRNKRNHPEIFGDPSAAMNGNNAVFQNGDNQEECRRKEQVNNLKINKLEKGHF